MDWYHYLLIAYAAAGIVVWLQYTLILLNVLRGKAQDKVPKDEMQEAIKEINSHQSPLIWLAAYILIVGVVALNLLRCAIMWPRVVYKRWQKSTK